jgi:hypothetical protein
VSRVVVDKSASVVRIRGPDKETVARARAIMEYSIDRITIPSQEVSWIIGPAGATIRKIREDSRVLNLELDQVRTQSRTHLPFLHMGCLV